VYNNVAKTYQDAERSVISGRETESRVLMKGALKLKACQDNWDADNRDEVLEDALVFNQQIWSILQTELMREDHPMPRKLRMDLLALAAFVDKRIFEVLAYPSPEKVDTIININRNIAAGLNGSSPSRHPM
jgi:flagellar protein FlaF